MTYRIEFKSSATKELLQLPRDIGGTVVQTIGLTQNSCPHVYKKTHRFIGQLSDLYR